MSRTNPKVGDYPPVGDRRGLHAFPDDPDWNGWWGDRPPFGYPVFVLTHSVPRPPIPMLGETTSHFRSAAIDDVLVGWDFLRAGLVDDLHVMIAPMLLGRGTRLWDDLRGLELTHQVRTEASESGTIHVTLSR